MKASPLRLVRFAPALVIALGLAASPGSADWVPNGNRLEEVTTSSSFAPQLGADPFGDLLVGFGPSTLLCTRVLGSGQIAAGWPTMVRSEFGYVSAPVPDGFDGAYVAIGGIGYVTVRRFRSDGTPDPDWPDSGLVVCHSPGLNYAQAGPHPAGGAYVMWTDRRNAGASTSGFPREIYGTRVLSGGSIAPGWNVEGTLLAAAPESVVTALGAVRPDGVGGAYAHIQRVHDFLAPSERREDYLLRVGPDGALPPGWPAGGWPAPNPANSNGFDYEPDGTGGAYVQWAQPQAVSYFGARLLRLLSTGEVAPGWPAGGMTVSDTTRLHFIKALAADGAGGIFAGVAIDTSGNLTALANRVFHFESSGEPAADWPAAGRPVPEPPELAPFSSFTPLLLASDALGGVFAVWAQSGDGQGSFAAIGAIHLDHFGEVAAHWPEGGLAVCDTTGLRRNLRVATDGIGRTYVAWQDHRPPYPENRYATYATRLDVVDHPTADVQTAALAPRPLRAAPNPFAGAVDLRLTLAEPGIVRLDILDVGGRIVRRLPYGWLPAGTHTQSWNGRIDAGSEAPAGLYFVRGSIGGRPVAARLVRIR
jgi:hypothetical protein